MYLSKKDIECIGERVYQAYRNLPDVVNTKVYKIIADKLIEDLLGLNLKYHHLSLDGSVLGVTSSFGGIEYKAFDYDDKETYCILDGKTILIERDLNNDCTQVGRCNFTKAHEAGHQILNMLFPKEFRRGSAQMHFCLAVSKDKTVDWIEWQANTLASVILMPKEIIRQALFLFGFGERISMINKVYATQEYERFSAMADFLGVSKTALSIRLSQLGLVGKNFFENPYDLTNIYNDGGI